MTKEELSKINYSDLQEIAKYLGYKSVSEALHDQPQHNPKKELCLKYEQKKNLNKLLNKSNYKKNSSKRKIFNDKTDVIQQRTLKDINEEQTKLVKKALSKIKMEQQIEAFRKENFK